MGKHDMKCRICDGVFPSHQQTEDGCCSEKCQSKIEGSGTTVHDHVARMIQDGQKRAAKRA